MAYPYKLHKLAHEEYIEAYEWYELKQKGLGGKFMNCVENKLRQISEHPEYYGRKQSTRFRETKVENFPFQIAYEFF